MTPQLPKAIGRLIQVAEIREAGQLKGATYRLNRADRPVKRFQLLRNTEFTIKIESKSEYRILIDGKTFEEAFTLADVTITLKRAFESECIRAGIDSASARFNSTGEEAHLTRRRYYQSDYDNSE